MTSPLERTDPEIADIIRRELERQNTTIQLIASENFTSRAVLEAQGSVLTNKYSEGYPAKRYYGGNFVVDEAENVARDRACALFPIVPAPNRCRPMFRRACGLPWRIRCSTAMKCDLPLPKLPCR